VRCPFRTPHPAEERPLNEIHLQLAGEVDFAVTPALRAQLLSATPAPDPANLVLDLSQVTLLDASALSMLVAVTRAYREVELHGACRVTRRALEVAGLTDLVTLA
jgi:anti-anti-sigma factor